MIVIITLAGADGVRLPDRAGIVVANLDAVGETTLAKVGGEAELAPEGGCIASIVLAVVALQAHRVSCK